MNLGICPQSRITRMSSPSSKSGFLPGPCLGCSVHCHPQYAGYPDIYINNCTYWDIKGHRLPLPKGLSKSEVLPFKIPASWLTKGR